MTLRMWTPKTLRRAESPHAAPGQNMQRRRSLANGTCHAVIISEIHLIADEERIARACPPPKSLHPFGASTTAFLADKAQSPPYPRFLQPSRSHPNRRLPSRTRLRYFHTLVNDTIPTGWTSSIPDPQRKKRRNVWSINSYCGNSQPRLTCAWTYHEQWLLFAAASAASSVCMGHKLHR